MTSTKKQTELERAWEEVRKLTDQLAEVREERDGLVKAGEMHEAEILDLGEKLVAMSQLAIGWKDAFLNVSKMPPFGTVTGQWIYDPESEPKAVASGTYQWPAIDDAEAWEGGYG